MLLISEYQRTRTKTLVTIPRTRPDFTPTVRGKSTGRTKTADAVAISGGSIRRGTALQMKQSYSHKFFISNRLWGRRRGQVSQTSAEGSQKQFRAFRNKRYMLEEGFWGGGAHETNKQKNLLLMTDEQKRCKWITVEHKWQILPMIKAEQTSMFCQFFTFCQSSFYG